MAGRKPKGGITLEVLAAASKTDDSFTFEDGNDSVSLKIRIGSVQEEKLYIFPDEDKRLSERFSKKLDMLQSYDVSDEIEKTREMEFLDQCRHEC